MVYTVNDYIIVCGVENDKLFDKLSPAVSFTVGIFTINFRYYMDK